MKKLLLLIFILLAGNLHADNEKTLDNLKSSWTFYGERCYEGVTYLVYSHSITVKFTRKGTVELCK